MKVVSLVAALLAAALIIMLLYSRRTVKREAVLTAEQTLEATMEHIDGILLSVEQSAGNIYFNLCRHLDDPEMMYVYSRRLVESNPFVSGCAIAFEPYYYKDRGEFFMAYYHRSGTGSMLVRSETFGNKPYNQQVWYTEPVKRGKPCWTDPLEDLDANSEAITTYSLPIYDTTGRRVAIMGVDVTINMLSRISLSVKPSKNSFSVMLGSDGSFIIHPDSTKRLYEKVYTLLEHGSDPSVKETVDAMMTGQKGYKRVKMDGEDCYVFYQPFTRNVVSGQYLDDMGWSLGVVYPEDDIFGDYNRLLSYVLLIAFISILLLALLCQFIIHRRLQPLVFLTKWAHRIANGHYEESIPESHHHDEIGQLQNHFQHMQVALAKHIEELENMNIEQEQRGERLRVAYHQAQAADRLKTSFLHNMTNQMLSPVQIISDRVRDLYQMQTMKGQDMDRVADDIQKQGEVIADLLNHLIELSKEKTGKEEHHG